MFGRQGAFYLGNLGPIPFFVHPSAIILALLVITSNPSGRIDDILVTLTVLIVSIVLHELGHALAARQLGAFGVTITLGGFGGLCESTRDSLPHRDLIILIAGPAVSFALWFGCAQTYDWLLHNRIDLLFDVSHRLSGGSLRESDLSLLGQFLDTGARYNLILGIFNSLPIFPLDGGQVVYNLIRLFPRSYTIARKATLFISFATGLALLMLIATFSSIQNNLWTVLMIGMLLFNAWKTLL